MIEFVLASHFVHDTTNILSTKQTNFGSVYCPATCQRKSDDLSLNEYNGHHANL